MREQQILIVDGYRVFRTEDRPKPRIKECKTSGSWSTYSTHVTKADRDRAWATLMEDKNNLEG